MLCQWMLEHSTNDPGGLDRLATTTEPRCIIKTHQSGVNAVSSCSMGT